MRRTAERTHHHTKRIHEYQESGKRQRVPAKTFDLYANVRPVSIPEEGIDWTFFRENTEGEYALGSCGIRIGDSLDVDFKVTTREGTLRIARAAFDFARANGKKRVSIVTKAIP